MIAGTKYLAYGFARSYFVHVKHGLNVLAHMLTRSFEHHVTSFYQGVICDCIRGELCIDVH